MGFKDNIIIIYSGADKGTNQQRVSLPGASRSERVRMTNQLKDRNDSIASTHRDFSGIVHRESHALHWYAGLVAGMTRYFRGDACSSCPGP